MLDVLGDSGLLILTLARGSVGNPLNPELLAALEKALADGARDPDIRAILIRSNTDRFSIGMDLKALLQDATEGDDNTVRQSIESYSRVLTRIYENPKPVLCSVSGEVRAGGVGIICACDIVISTPDAAFSLSEVLFGLVAANVLPYLLGLRVSPAKARYLMLSARVLSGREAYDVGIVDAIAERDQMEKAIRSNIRQIMRSSPKALETTKRLTTELIWKDLDYRKKRAVDALERLARDPAVLDAIQAYQEGMTPDWFAKFKPEADLFLEEQL